MQSVGEPRPDAGRSGCDRISPILFIATGPALCDPTATGTDSAPDELMVSSVGSAAVLLAKLHLRDAPYAATSTNMHRRDAAQVEISLFGAILVRKTVVTR